MAGLIPIGGGGGGPAWPTCFRCGEPALGPCALCRVMICASEECSTVVEDPGLPRVVLCADCVARRGVLAMSAKTAPLSAAAGAALLVILVLSGGASTLAAVGYIASALLLLFALAVAVARWQWRARLSRARGGRSP